MIKLFVFFILSHLGYAGTSSSSGGGSVLFCKNEAGPPRVEFLDLWEGTYLEEFKINRTNTSLDVQIGRALQFIQQQNLYFYSFAQQNYFYILANSVYLNPPIELLPPSDISPIFHTPNCHIEGYLYYDGDRQKLYISKKNDDLLVSVTDRAAGVIHEIVYKTLRDLYNDATSIRTRRMVAWLFSDQPQQVAEKKTYTSYLRCRGSQLDFLKEHSSGQTKHFIFYQVGSFRFPQGLSKNVREDSRFVLQHDFLDGLQLQGYEVQMSKGADHTGVYGVLYVWDHIKNSVLMETKFTCVAESNSVP